MGSKLLKIATVILMATGASQAMAGYSAIAYNANTQAWGEGHGYDTSTDAVNAAVASCGGGCTWLAWAQNSCVALANDPSSGAYGYSWGNDNSDDAVNAAMASCDSQIAAGACSWRVWACN